MFAAVAAGPTTQKHVRSQLSALDYAPPPPHPTQVPVASVARHLAEAVVLLHEQLRLLTLAEALPRVERRHERLPRVGVLRFREQRVGALESTRMMTDAAVHECGRDLAQEEKGSDASAH